MDSPAQRQLDVGASLRRVAQRWSELSAEIERATELRTAPGSQFERDQQRLRQGGMRGTSIALYARERLLNAKRVVVHLEHVLLRIVPSELNADVSVIHPLLRAALEDATAVLWLLEPADQDLRLAHGLQLLWEDARFMTRNHATLARASRQLPLPPETADELEANMLDESVKVDALFTRTANDLGLDVQAIKRGPHRSRMLADHFGADSLPLATWKLLSDSSHFSLTMRKHFAAHVPEPGGPEVGHVALVVLAMDVNRCVGLAVTAYERAQN